MQKIIKSMESSNLQSSIKFVNSVLNSGLPVEEIKPQAVRQVKGFNFSRVKTTPVEGPRIASLSKSCLQWLGI